MTARILLNALDQGDAVSLHCLLLQRYLTELGIPATIYSSGASPSLLEARLPAKRILEGASTSDILFHQLFNDTPLVPFVEQFPGRRVVMYHNITPPHFFPPGSPVHADCAAGLRLAATLGPLYDYAVGMSDFSRRDLDSLGYSPTGVFPLLLDLESLTDLEPDPWVLREKHEGGATLLFVGRLAPNKRIARLLDILAAYRRLDSSARLVVVGNDRQHEAYVESLSEHAAALGLRRGADFLFPGKIPAETLAAWFRAADAFVCASSHEGFCAPLIEAMSFDLPVFTVDEAACAETVASGGILIPSQAPDRAASLIHRTLHDPAALADLAQGRAARLRDFTPEAQRSRLAAHLDHVGALPAKAATWTPPRISVVINTFNRGAYLERCLEALSSQTYPNFEVVVVNGPSTDDTMRRLDRFEGKVRVVQTDTRVLGVSRNCGIRAANGELVAFTDDDAIPDRNWLSELAPAFQTPDVGGAGGLVYRMDGRYHEFANGVIDRLGAVEWDRPLPGAHFHWEEERLNTVSGNNCIFRRAALERIGGFDEAIEYYHDEADVVLRLEAAGFRIVHRPRAVVHHEAARGHNRSTRYNLNWYVILKNTLYVALKNYPRSSGRTALARQISVQLLRQRIRQPWIWLRRKEVGFGDFLEIEWKCWRGLVTGLDRGLRPRPRHTTFEPARAGDFLPYPTGANATGHWSVCILTQSLPEQSPGGVATYTLSLARSLSAMGCTVHLVSGEVAETGFRDGIWRHPVRPRSWAADANVDPSLGTVHRVLDYAAGARDKVLEIDARWGLDIVEAPSWDAEGVALALDPTIPLAIRLHSPLFTVIETQNWPRTGDLALACEVEGIALRRATAVYGSTQALISSVFTHYSLNPEVHARIPIGLDLQPHPAPPDSAGPQRVLFVGRLEPRKGIGALLDAIPRVLASAPEVHFDIAGKDEPDSWRNRFEDLHPALRDRVHFHGEVSESERDELYARCALFVAPSVYESYGLVYLEAMAHGKPVIGTNSGGIPEVIEDGVTGLLVPPNNAPALAEAILSLATDPDRRARMAEAARQAFEHRFSARAMAEKTLALYRDTAAAWASQRPIVYEADAIAMGYSSSLRVGWDPVGQHTCLIADPGQETVMTSGPSLQLPPGGYVAEFALRLESAAAGHWLVSVEVVDTQAGSLAAEQIEAQALPPSGASLVRLFFRLEGLEERSLEFRVIASGLAGVHLRKITVRRIMTSQHL